MLRVRHHLTLPHPVEAVLAQYVDLEHIPWVHPHLGHYEGVTVEGRTIRYVQVWPAWWGWRARSYVEQVHTPPDRMDFRFTRGLLRGVQVLTRIRPGADGTTVIDETYLLPWLPDWAWLARLVQPWIVADVHRIWTEDQQVGLPRGGWPGLPGLPTPPEHPLARGERRCPHAGGPLRPCADGGWRCPWHGARYDAQGVKADGPGPDRLEAPEAP